MAQTGIVRDERYLEHDMGSYHVENPERLVHIYRALDEIDIPLEEITPRAATREEITAVHDPQYVDHIAATAGQSAVYLDADTSTSARTYEVSLLAAGGLLAAVDAVMGDLTNAFALVRPPGHHAERNRAMGFCIFNNIAVGARYALSAHGLERILIVDWDLHHGNGTQKTFYGDPQVLYFSTHQYPYYPGSGHYIEIGEGAGKGYTVNVPLSTGYGDADYANFLRRVMSPIALAYQPQLILVSAGFDIYRQDPLGGMNVTEEGFARLIDIIMDVADTVCDGRLVVTLEGGYHLEGQARSVVEVVKRMTGDGLPDRGRWEEHEAKEYSHIRELVAALKKNLNDFWELDG